MQGRYGRIGKRKRRWPTVLLAVVVWSVGLAWLAWVIADQSSPVVQSQMQTFSVDADGRQARASVTVQLDDPRVRASCLIRATAADSSAVGEESFIATGFEGTRRFEVVVRTEREASSVVSVGCTAPGQPRPR
ncbi:DUF4307 domain-containing protein [Nocardioides marmoraquaticus]